ncbi:MAG: HAD family hydrolase [Candidatus Korobacteraceae bacterium]
MDGVYSRIRRPVRPGAALRAAVFLDRDGVITEDTHYLHRAEDVRLIPGAVQAVADINQLGFPVVLVTNQAGIGRGYYGWPEFEAVQECVERGLASCGGWVDAVWACSYHPDGGTDGPASYYRKPSPGMLEEAAVKLALDLGNSWLAGDKPCDIGAAINAGVRRAVHVLTGYGRETRDEVHRLTTENRASCEVHFCDAISDIVPLLKANRGPHL